MMELLVKLGAVSLGWFIAYVVVWVMERNQENKVYRAAFGYMFPAVIVSTCMEYFTGIYSLVWMTLSCVVIYLYLKRRYKRSVHKAVFGDDIGTRHNKKD